MPLGFKRQVVVNPKTRIWENGPAENLGGEACGDYDLCFWLALSAMIVPYESCVVWADAKVPAEHKVDFCLSFQEKQHSAIHGRYNNHFFNGGVVEGQPLSAAMPRSAQLVFRAYCVFLDAVVPVAARYLAPIADGLIAIVEHGFLHSYTHKGVFALLSTDVSSPSVTARRAPLLAKIILWHFFEETEHSMEATASFHLLYGLWAYPILIVSTLFAAFFFLSMSATALVASVLVAPRNLPFILTALVKDLVHDDVFVMAGLMMLIPRLQFTDDHARREIALYKKRFESVYGNSLSDPKLMLTVYARSKPTV